MENKKKSSASGFVAVLLLVVAFLLSWFWIVPQYRQNKADTTQVDYDLTAAKAKLDSLKSAKSTLDSLGTTADSMLVAIPSDQDTGNTITTLEAIATANQMYIPGFQISDNSGTISVSFSISGNFAGTNGFIKGIEDNLRFFAIKSVSVAPADDGTFSMTLALEAYTQGSSSSVGSEMSAETIQ